MIATMRPILDELLKDFRPPVLDVGSLTTPGQEVLADFRNLFPGEYYCGLDIREGPGVDKVYDGRDFPFGNGSFASVICTDTLEHVKDFWQLLKEIHRVLVPRGRLLLTSVFHFQIHEYPFDYWRFTPAAFELLLKDFQDVKVMTQGGSPRLPISIIGIGSKP